jgi:hypothetical protein
METRRWTNPTQPQTLQIAVFLLYANAVLGLLLGNVLYVWGTLIGLGGLVAFAAAGFGIANEKRWGYNLGIGVAGLEVLTLVRDCIGWGHSSDALISLMFAVALVALLLHPHSREYEKIWFS